MKALKNLQKFNADPLDFLDHEFKHGHEAIRSVKIGPKTFHLVFCPELAQMILTKNSSTFIQNRSIFDRIRPITGKKGLVQLNGTHSQEMRKRIRPMLSSSNIELMNEIIENNTHEALKNLRADTYLDVTQFMADLVLKNAFELFLGIKISHDLDSLVSDFRELNTLCGKRMVSLAPLPLVIPNFENRRILYLRNKIRSSIRSLLQNRSSHECNIHSIFSHDETLIDQCMTFLFAGHETTASSLSFTMLLLGNNPQYQELIQSGDDDLAMKVYQEALRLFPPAYMLAREVASNTSLHNVSMKKGDQVLIGVHQIHRHQDHHEDALKFLPERFDHNVSAFLPFGLGPKNCIGERIAYREAVTIISLFCKKVKFDSVKKNISFVPLVTLHPREGQLLKVEGIYG